jgi:cyanate permease
MDQGTGSAREKPAGAAGEGLFGVPYPWVMLALLWLLYAAFGLIQRSIAPLVTPILADLRLSYAQMGFILGSWQLTYIAAAMIAGTLVDRWGIRKALFAGASILGLSAGLRCFVTGFGGMLASVALSGIGGPLISVGCPKAIAVWFEGKARGTAVGIYLSGPWVGGIAALTLTNSLVMPLVGQSWRRTFLVYGLVTLGTAAIWWLLGRDVHEPAAGGSVGVMLTFRRLTGVRNVRIVLALGLLIFAILHALTSWLPKILESGGLSPALAGLAAAVPLAAGVPALWIVPRLIPPARRGTFLAFSAVAMLVTLVTILTASGAPLLAALILFGLAITPCYPLLTLILMDAPEVGARHMGSASGMFFCISEIGGFTGPLILGIIVDATGSFGAGIFFFAALCLATLAFSVFLSHQPSAVSGQPRR